MSQDLNVQIDNLQIVQKEIDLVLLCCRINLDENCKAQILSLLQHHLDWQWIFGSVTCHGVLPLLYNSLSAVQFSNVPEAVRKKLQEASFINYFRNEKLLALLQSIIELCRTKNVEILSFKGPLLSKVIYGDIGFRQISDLDFLIKFHDAQTVKELILSQGYSIHFDGMNKIYLQDGYSHLSFFNPQTTTTRLDFQWNIGRSYSYFRYDINKVWDRVRPIRVGENNLSAISNEDLLFLLSMHGNNHAWEKLKWICDISELLQKNYAYHWDYLLHQARDIGILRILLTSLTLAANLFQLRLPDTVRFHIERDKKTHQLTNSLESQLFANTKFPSRTLSRMLFVLPENIAYQIHSRERYFDKCRFVFFSFRPNLRKFIPTAKDKSLVRLPQFLSFTYYVIRPLRLIIVYAPKLILNKMRGNDNQ